MDRKAGVDLSFDEAYVVSALDRRIQSSQDVIRVAEELRAVIVRPITSGATAPPLAAPRKRRSVAQ